MPESLFDGRIRGNGLAFSIGNLAVNPCHLHAVITASEDGVATALSGGGRCLIPGHPHSEAVIELDPPPAGNSITLSFEAWRD